MPDTKVSKTKFDRLLGKVIATKPMPKDKVKASRKRKLAKVATAS